MPNPSPLMNALDQVGPAVEAAGHVLVFLDFDGTLAPIVPTPERAGLPGPTRAVVEELGRSPRCTVGIVSGRALDDVRARVGIDGLVYVGNHGLEIDGGGLHLDHHDAERLADDTARAVDALSGRLAHLSGAFAENKGPTASVHYRLVPGPLHQEVELAVREVVPDDHPTLVVQPGKMIWEVRPRVDWNKGSAVRWIRERLGRSDALTFYLGDDRTDEDAFAEVGPFVTARVGPPQPTRAGYRLADTHEVAEFLEWLARALRSAGTPRSV